MTLVRWATVPVLALALSGCAAVSLPNRPPALPASTHAPCTPDVADITLGRGSEGGEPAVIFSGSASTSRDRMGRTGESTLEQSADTITVVPSDAFDGLEGTPEQWEAMLAARAIAAGRADYGWADRSALAQFAAQGALAVHLPAAGHSIGVVTVSPVLSLDFVIACDGRSTTLTLGAPDPTVVTTITVDCDSRAKVDAQQTLARQQCSS